MKDNQKRRYARHILLREVGGQGQQKLLASKVLVVGAGGLGAPVIEYLAAAGVGTLGIADDDVVDLSNLQRQVIFKTADVGAQKTAAAKAFVNDLNPDIEVVEHPMRLDRKAARDLVPQYDLVIEGVDNFETRYALSEAAMTAGVPLVSAAIGRFEGQLTTFRAFDRPGEWPCYRCLAPEAPPREAQVNCAEEGVLGAVAGVMGALAAMEALKQLLGLGDGLVGRLLLYQGLSGEFRTVSFPADPACPACAQMQNERR